MPAFMQPIFGKIVDKHGTKYVICGGLFLSYMPFAFLGLVWNDSTASKVCHVDHSMSTANILRYPSAYYCFSLEHPFTSPSQER